MKESRIEEKSEAKREQMERSGVEMVDKTKEQLQLVPENADQLPKSNSDNKAVAIDEQNKTIVTERKAETKRRSLKRISNPDPDSKLNTTNLSHIKYKIIANVAYNVERRIQARRRNITWHFLDDYGTIRKIKL